jgi:HEAT repeats
MRHEQFKEWLSLSVVEELSGGMQELLDNHLRECSECQQELAGLKKFASAIAGHTPAEVNEDLLREARQQLRLALLERRFRKSIPARVFESVREWFARDYRIGLAGLAMSVFGVCIGYALFSQPRIVREPPLPAEPGIVQQAVETGSSRESFTQGETRTSNVDLIDAGGKDGVVDFTFDAVTPMHVRGNINDEKVQKVLARALITEDNAGVRLRTVSAIASQLPAQKSPDAGIKAALISALKEDQNTGVRQEALRVLLRYRFDADIREALVYTLTHDKNSGMRIAAINGLATASVDGYEMNRDILEILKHKMQSDKNNYVRRQAQTVLEEVTHR